MRLWFYRTRTKQRGGNLVYDWKKTFSDADERGPRVPPEFDKINKGLTFVPQRLLPIWMFTDYLVIFSTALAHTTEKRLVYKSWLREARKPDVGFLSMNHQGEMFADVCYFLGSQTRSCSKPSTTSTPTQLALMLGSPRSMTQHW